MAMNILTDYGLNVSPKFICWCPGAQSDGIRKWVLGRCFGHVGGAIMNEASVLIGGLGIPFPFSCHMMIRYRKILGPRRSPSPHHADILILEIQSLKLWEIDFFVSYTICEILLEQPGLRHCSITCFSLIAFLK